MISPLRRSRQPARRSSHTLYVFLLVLPLVTLACALSAQKLHPAPHAPDLHNGKLVWDGGCVACHGVDGSGAPSATTFFQRADTFPDFTRCDQTTSEPDSDYKAVILHGGPYRGFAQIMPAFGESLTPKQVDDVVAYLRSFCVNKHHYPHGELNLPRAIATEKAFPEDELVLTTASAVKGPASNTTDAIHEQTFGGRNQIEVDVPINHADLNGHGTTGVGDITLGLKREVWSNLRSGSILSLQGGILLPTGDSHRGFGAGTTTFEPFASFDQLFPTNSFVQFQIGADLPYDTSKAPRSLFVRTALGQSLAQDHGLGRLFTPMVELLADRTYSPGAVTDWDVLPQMQVTLNKRQHIRADVGYRTPVNDRQNRVPEVDVYVLWDWAEGHFWSGWR